MKRNIIHATGREYATLVYSAKHKKNGSAILRIFPVRYLVASKSPVPVSDYEADEALVTIKFENRDALESLMVFIRTMRDNMLRFEGMEKGAAAAQFAMMMTAATEEPKKGHRRAMKKEKKPEATG